MSNIDGSDEVDVLLQVFKFAILWVEELVLGWALC